MSAWISINDSLPGASGDNSPLLWLYAGGVILGRYTKGTKPEGGEFTGFSDEQGQPVVASHYRHREAGEEAPASP